MPAADAVESGRLREQLATMTTEAHRPELADIDRLPTLDIARFVNAEDATVATAVAARLPEIAAAIDGVTERMARGGRLVYAGAGTAGRLGVLDASECPPTFNTDPAQVVGLIAGGPAAVVSAVEGAEDREDAARADLDAPALTADDVVVGISASGRTPYAVAAVRHARALGALTVGLSCNGDSALAAAADHGIEVVVGPETLTGSTRLKAGTARKLVLNMISTITVIKLGVSLATGARDESVGTALADNDGEVKNSILTLLASVDAPTAARLLQDAHGHLRKALEAAAA